MFFRPGIRARIVYPCIIESGCALLVHPAEQDDDPVLAVIDHVGARSAGRPQVAPRPVVEVRIVGGQTDSGRRESGVGAGPVVEVRGGGPPDRAP